MSINPIKEFFRRRKAEAKFSKAGPGQTLSTTSQGNPGTSSEHSSARQAAAEAAMKRFSKDDKKPSQRPKISHQQSTKVLNSEERSTEDSNKPTPKDKFAPKELPVVNGIVERNVQLLSADELAARTMQPDIDDDFFRLTKDDVILYQQRCNEERARNEILKTSEMRKREAEAKKSTTNIARLRFKLPNDCFLEASFSGNETLSIVRDWLVATLLEKSDLDLGNFDILFGLRPFKPTDYDTSIKRLGLIPATTLTIVKKQCN